jgi:hypothetical protein
MYSCGVTILKVAHVIPVGTTGLFQMNKRHVLHWVAGRGREGIVNSHPNKVLPC